MVRLLAVDQDMPGAGVHEDLLHRALP
jgi:hypothetical protein